MSKAEESVLCCPRVVDLPEHLAATTGSVKRNCSRCGCEVWVVPRNLLLKARILCMPCTPKVMCELPPEEPIRITAAEPHAREIERRTRN